MSNPIELHLLQGLSHPIPDLTCVLESLEHGGVVLLYGPTMTGKTVMLHALANAVIAKGQKVVLFDDCHHLHPGVSSSDRTFANHINGVIALTGLEVGLFPLRALAARGYVVIVVVTSPTRHLSVIQRLRRWSSVIIETTKLGYPPKLLKINNNYRHEAVQRIPWPTKKG